MVDLHAGGATDIGGGRELNEDGMLFERPIFVVADGMGGLPAGGQASEIAIERLRSCANGPTTSTEAVLEAVNQANAEILSAADHNPDNAGMGTTIAGLALVTDSGVERWLAFNVGDSRIYRLAGTRFEQISVDHSEVQELIAAGRLAAEDRDTHPMAHVITRVLGSMPPPEADCWLLHPVAGERFLLCSDGLSGQLHDDAIAALLGTGDAPDAIARGLVAAAVAAGAADNVTAVVVVVPGSVEAAATTGRRRGSAA